MRFFYEKAATGIEVRPLGKVCYSPPEDSARTCWPPLVVLVAYDAKLIFGFLLGSKWVAAGSFAAILAFLSFLYFLTSWLDRLFDVRGPPKDLF